LTAKQQSLDLQPIQRSAAAAGANQAGYQGIRNDPHDHGALNRKLVQMCASALESGSGGRHAFDIRNHDRSVGASLSGQIARRYGREGLPGKPFELTFTGSAGQSFGVWNTPGMDLRLVGDANDYVGKGMSGGRISISPHPDARIVAKRSVIMGNTCLYGATGGELFAAGQAGERFAVRNSGATAVVEGLGHHGCEYMTAGLVLVLGRVGSNFAAGMTGGRAFVLDMDERFARRCNPESVTVHNLDAWEHSQDTELLKSLLRRHHQYTGSVWAARLVDDFDHFAYYFRVVEPRRESQSAAPAAPIKLVK
jgi:glutamate synthase (NADPH/NADH) large chain